MNNVNLEIRCLARLDELIASNETIMEFLVSEELMTKEERRVAVTAPDVAKCLQAHLAKLKGNKLQLLTYEWIVLPDERLKVSLVSDRNSKEFSYNF